MARVPNIDSATIDPRKATEYLLDEDHRVGGSKARLLMSFGFDPQHPEQLLAALRDHGRIHDAQPLPATKHGSKYVVRGLLKTPDGRALRIRTVWIFDAGGAFQRLVTAVPD